MLSTTVRSGRSAAWPATRRLEAARSSHAVVGVVGRGRGIDLHWPCNRERRATPTANCGPAAALSCAPLACLRTARWRARLRPRPSRWGPHLAPRGRRLWTFRPPSPAPSLPAVYCAAAADPPHCHIQGITCSRSATEQNPLTARRSGIDSARAESQGCTTTTFKQNTESGLLPTASVAMSISNVYTSAGLCQSVAKPNISFSLLDENMRAFTQAMRHTPYCLREFAHLHSLDLFAITSTVPI
ncbi:hypothetical protein Zmor_002702 [Zophobas morio]|uniref:Uncharacterized protein n=1 Tax=Zophobas morio TaxID=2755281 RepID=A0AA38M1D9_9CUCU|nr:hypothetical protein Zmor_002702 [Zophobas morio]